MKSDDLWQTWAPSDGLWSPWVKPVLFAWAHDHPVTPELPVLLSEVEFSWVPALSSEGRSALILDLPGAEGVAAGLAVVGYGYCPIPLYNALPGTGTPSLVQVVPIVQALAAAAPRLGELRLPADAPPAFLLDSRRRHGAVSTNEHSFDNRSISFPTDFPSANFLLSQKITHAVLVQRGTPHPAADLAHTLCAWHEAGIIIRVKEVGFAGPPLDCDVPKPRFFRRCFYRALEMLGLRRNVLGGFGGTLDGSSSGG